MFAQGQYVGAVVEGENRSAGLRWHEGVIQKIYKDSGVNKYDGKHTRGAADGKWCTFKGYDDVFVGLELADLRVAPNVFDIMDAEDDGEDAGEDTGAFLLSYK